MISILLLITGIQFATNNESSFQYAIEHQKPLMASIQPLNIVVPVDTNDYCYDFSCNCDVSSNECYGVPPPITYILSCTADFQSEPNTQIEWWYSTNMRTWMIYGISNTNWLVVTNLNNKFFKARATCLGYQTPL